MEEGLNQLPVLLARLDVRRSGQIRVGAALPSRAVGVDVEAAFADTDLNADYWIIRSGEMTQRAVIGASSGMHAADLTSAEHSVETCASAAEISQNEIDLLRSHHFP